jgi:ABC-type nitrate/sulfonate/bicarbonate transport system substrate-binding protein
MDSRPDREGKAARLALALLAAATVAIGVATCGGSDDESASADADGALTLGLNDRSPLTQLVTHVAIDEGFFEAEGIPDIDVVTTDRYVERLVEGDIDISQGRTDALLAKAHEGPSPEPEVLLLGAHRLRGDEPVDSIATTDDLLDARVDLVSGYLAAQLRARAFLHDEENLAAVLDIAQAHKLSIPAELEASWNRWSTQITANGGFSADRMDHLVAEAQAAGRLPDDLDWRVHVNFEPLHFAQEEAGVRPSPSPADLAKQRG